MADIRNADKIFRTAFLGGYQKADVEEYMESLLTEMEESCKEREALKKELNEEKEASRAAADRLTEENIRIEKENEQLKQMLAELREKEEKSEELNRDLREQVSIYEKRSAVVADVLTEARMNADQLLENANLQAKTMIRQAEEDTQLLKKAGDELMRKETQKHVEQLTMLQVRMNVYLNALDKIQNGIGEIYGSLSKTVGSIPASVDTFRSMAEIGMDKDEEEYGDVKLIE